MRNLIAVVAGCSLVSLSLIACGRMEQSSRARPGDGAVIYQSTILTMDARHPAAEAVIVKDGVVVEVGGIDDLVQAYPGAAFDERYLRRVLLPAFVDARERPPGFAVIEVSCGGAISADDILAAGAGGGAVRLVAEGAAAIAAVVGAVEDLPEGAAIGRIAIEAHDDSFIKALGRLPALGVAVIISDDPPPDECANGEGYVEPLTFLTTPTATRLIALAPAAGETNFLKAAAARLGSASPPRLSPQEALEAITIDAAYALGRESDQGSIAVGKRARFAVLGRNPLATPAEGWGGISVEVADLTAAGGE